MPRPKSHLIANLTNISSLDANITTRTEKKNITILEQYDTSNTTQLGSAISVPEPVKTPPPVEKLIDI